MAQTRMEDDFDDRALSQVLLDVALTPLRILTSRDAFRTYLRAIILTLATCSLLAVASFAYGTFYYKYIPERGVRIPVHVQFEPLQQTSTTATHPQGTANLPPYTLISAQPYNTLLHLCLPRTPENMAAGNFMLDLSLLGPWTTPPTPDDDDSKLAPILATSSRSAILPYANPLTTRIYQLLVRTPLALLGFGHGERECISLLMLERHEFSSGAKSLPTLVDVKVRSALGNRIRLYSLDVEIQAVFTGLRWLMRTWWLSSAMLGVSIFFGISAATCVGTWAVFALVYSGRGSGTAKAKGKQSRRVKGENAEEQEEQAMSDTSRTFPTSSRQPPLEYHSSSTPIKDEDETVPEPGLARGAQGAEADDEDESERDDYVLETPGDSPWAQQDRDSGIGTSMESSAGGESGRNLARRRVKREGE